MDIELIYKEKLADYKLLLEKYKQEDFESKRNANEAAIEVEIARELKDNKLAREITTDYNNIKKLSELDAHNADYNNYLRRAKKELQDIITIAEKD